MANSPEEQRQSGMITRKGLLLKEAREAKGITIATVHEMTKIPLDVLHAIEEGYTVRMVSAYYFKGFIKMYAKFLDLDPRLVLDEPTASTDIAAVPIKPTAGDIRLRKFNEFINRQSKKQLTLRFVVTALVVVGLLVVFIVFKKAQHNFNTPGATVRKELPKKKVLVKTVEKKAAPKAPAPSRLPRPIGSLGREEVAVAVPPQEARSLPPQEENENGQKKTMGKKVNLTIKARTTGWLQVKVDGNIVFQSTMHEGTTETWQAEQSIELSGKNINNLEFEVNGKVLGQLSKSDRGARRVIVTNEGLSVRK